MAVKILVVDDSTTMRKIMAMTFAAESAQVETVGGVDAALQKIDSFAPDVVFADLSMVPDGYELAKAVKAKNPNTAVIALSSQHAAFDAAKGGAAGIDDNIVKPFDTQSVIDRVAQVLARPRAQLLAGATLAGVPQTGGATAATTSTAAAPAAPAVAAPVAPAAPRPPMTAPGSSAAIPLAASPRDMKRTMAFGMPLAPVTNPVGPVQGATGGAPPMPSASAPAAPAGPAPVVPRPAGAVAPAASAPAAPAAPAAVSAPAAPAVPKPTPAAAPPAAAAPAPAAAKPVAAAPAPTPASPVAAVAGAVVSASLATKLGGLGLSKDQIEGVLALSREIVEQVVWEVVPELAETMIREEIKRLTAG